MKRRSFLQKMSFTILSLPQTLKAKTYFPPIKNSPFETENGLFFPIRELDRNSSGSHSFNGEDIDKPHEILWDVNNYLLSKGGVPPASLNCDVVVVGGGVAGLSTCYFLKKKNPDTRIVLLEGAEQVGGNSKGENWGGAYSLGAAYIAEPEENTPIAELLTELGLTEKDWRVETSPEMKVVFKNKLLDGFFEGKLVEGEEREQFLAIVEKLNEIYQNAYPDMPYKKESALPREEFDKLDSISFLKWFENNFTKRPVLFDEFVRLYCYSSFGADWDEISAAQGLNFFTSDMQGTAAFPGGNSRILNELVKKLLQMANPPLIKNNAFVARVKIEQEKVLTTFEDKEGKLHTIESKAVVVSTPKKVAKHIVADMDKEQFQAIDKLHYRSYLVINCLLKKKIPSLGYDLFCLKGSIQESSKENIESRVYTDFIYGSWAEHDQSERSVLTFYLPRAYQGAEHFLLNSNAHEKYKQKFKAVLGPLLETLEIKEQDILGMRLTRWGHALPTASTAFIASGLAEKAHTPIQDKIFFAHQDNWANPCFETAMESARAVVESLKL